MKRISADYIFPGNTSPIKNGVLVLGEDNSILAVLDPLKDDIDWNGIDKYDGILCPGFVNTHCHLELSALKNKVQEKTHLHGFIKEIITIRNDFTEEERLEAIMAAEAEMISNGIVAVGDISNGDSTFGIKQRSKLKYHTFIEVFGSNPGVAQEAFRKAEVLYNDYFDRDRVSITPHATYSVSDPLTKLINAHCETNNSLISIHNQETESENEFFKEGKGQLFDFLEISKNQKFIPTGKNALASFLGKYQIINKVLLVHNTFSNLEDIEWASFLNPYWAFCPNANLYIEDKLPNFNLFLNEKCTIGTDSLASNWGLSILSELKTISKHYPNIDLQTLIKWATYNGADFLNFNDLGSLEKGKAPGVNLIQNVDSDTLSLTTNSTVKVLI